jgi:polyhydroxyalkanoate synthase
MQKIAVTKAETADACKLPFPAMDRVLHASIGRLTGGVSPAALSLAYTDWVQHLIASPDKQLELAHAAAVNLMCFIGEAAKEAMPLKSEDAPGVLVDGDKRFNQEGWRRWPFNQFAAAHGLYEHWWRTATTGISGVSAHHEAIVSFIAQQMADVVSPANFVATNPELLEKTVQQGGMNLLKGALNFLEDWRRIQAGEKPAGVENFLVGHNIAVTPGKVIVRNRLMELIQYAPVSATVHAEPILIVPAWIMKYYILDLSPENSLVKYLIGKGHTVFMVSWKNPDSEDRDLDFEDYYRLGVQDALDAIEAILPGRQIHATGYCLGGTLLATAAAALARDGDKRLKTVTLFAAQTDFTEAGELMLFIDDAEVSFLEDSMSERGYLDAKQMAGAFQLLRSNDLIWSRIMHDYLMGEREPMFDLMAWNADTTRMPYRMHSTYLRRLFLNNELAEGHFAIGGRPVSLRDIRMPIFAVSTLADHVAPWRSVYKIQALTDADVTFVLSNGGHNAGIVNPPGNPKRFHQIATHKESEDYIDPGSWQKSATRHEGSWWSCWQSWLVRNSSEGRVPPPKMGAEDKGFPVLCDAPGTYVLAR